MSETKMMSDGNLPFFLAQNTGFGVMHANDELLHPDSFANVTDASATETQYFGFSVPEKSIHGLAYTWHHPNLKVVSGGLFVFRGIKNFTAQAELCDYRTFMRDDLITKDFADYRLDGGYGVRVLEPMKRFHMTYSDPARKNSVNLIYEGLQPVVMFADGNHFEQTMSVKGELVLRGERFAVDCFNIRDRSWGKPRPELLMPVPPNSWMIGAFGNDFSFNCNMFDQAKNNQQLPPTLALPEDRCLNSGWVIRNGKLGRIVQASKTVIRDEKQLFSKRVHLNFTDEHNRNFDISGSLVAACNFPAWINMVANINLMRWECDGLIGYGDNQESFWNDYLNAVGV